jgi:adenosylmethionine-8-amino-7-oxononanoate aminotransferase
MVQAGDVAGELQKLGVKEEDTVVVKMLFDDDYPMPTQKDVDDIRDAFAEVLKHTVSSILVLPLAKSTDFNMRVLDEQYKEELRSLMREFGVIE